MKCIICGTELMPLYLGAQYDPEDFSEQMIDGETVDKLYMPYGSELDGNVYVFALCDACIEAKHKEGIITLKNYD